MWEVEIFKKRRRERIRGRGGAKKLEGLSEWGGDLSDGTRSGYIGMLENWHKMGLGEYRDVDGSVYRGEWSDDYMHGWGEYITPNGVSFKGRWDHGRLNEKTADDLKKEAIARYAYDSISISYLNFYLLSLFLFLSMFLLYISIYL